MAHLRDSISSQSAANELSIALTGWLQTIEIQDLFRTCTTCNNFKNDNFCTKFNANPPGTVIIKGCDSYDDLEAIPF